MAAVRATADGAGGAQAHRRSALVTVCTDEGHGMAAPSELPAPPRDSRGVSKASNSRVVFPQSFTFGRIGPRAEPRRGLGTGREEPNRNSSTVLSAGVVKSQGKRLSGR